MMEREPGSGGMVPHQGRELYPDEDRVSVLDLFNVLLRHGWLLLLLPLLLGLGFATSRLIQPRAYEASAAFVSHTGADASSPVAGLASQFGLNINVAARAESPQFYVELLESRALLEAAVTSEYTFVRDDEQVTGTLIELHGIDGNEREQLRRGIDRLQKSMTVSASPATGIVTLEVAASDPVLAEQIAARLLDLLGTFNVQTRRSRAANEEVFVRARMEEAQQELLAAENELQSFLARNRQFMNSPELVFEHDRLQREVGMRQQLYSALVQSHESARIDAVRNTPVITIVEAPERSAEPVGRGTIMWGVIGLLAGALLAVVLAFVFDISRTLQRTDRPDVREFQRLRQQWTRRFR